MKDPDLLPCDDNHAAISMARAVIWALQTAEEVVISEAIESSGVPLTSVLQCFNIVSVINVTSLRLPDGESWA